jgi:phage tail protein X
MLTAVHGAPGLGQERRFPEAFSALSEAVKYKRESWQTWANYAHAALQTGQPLQGTRGVAQARAFPPLPSAIALTCPDTAPCFM